MKLSTKPQLLILVFDYSSTLTEEDLEILRSTEGKKRNYCN